MNCCVDWLTFTIEKTKLWDSILMDTRIDQLKETLETGPIFKLCQKLMPELPFVAEIGWTYGPGRYSFKHRQYYQGIEVIYGGTEGQGTSDLICINITGQGCRTYESYHGNFDMLLSWAFDHAKHVTRLDLAVDDKEGTLDIDRIYKMSGTRYDRKGQENPSCKWWGSFKTVTRTQGDNGTTIYFGSEASKVRIRIYDKAAEQGIEGHWIRTEVVLRDEKSRDAIGHILETGEAGKVFASILKSTLLFYLALRQNSPARMKQSKLQSVL